MDLLELFKRQLADKEGSASKNTVKNYLADIRHFIAWCENIIKRRFEAENITPDIVRLYEKSLGGIIENGIVTPNSQLSVSSMKRHLSSLRKFVSVLEAQKLIPSNPFAEIKPPVSEEVTDFWHLRSFRDHLLASNASKLTVKNYIADIQGFAKWYEEAVLPGVGKPLTSTGGFYLITQNVLSDYKKRLIEVQSAAPRTVNRKLSSLRKYLDFAVKKGFIDAEELTLDPVEVINQEVLEKEIPQFKLEEISLIEPQKKHSKIPPVRLFQKLFIFPYLSIEEKTADIIAGIISGRPVEGIQKLPKRITDSLASKNSLRLQNQTLSSILGIKNVEKEFYAPEKVSLLGVPLHKRVIYHARYTRPNWYKKYHSFQFVHYAHFALLVIFAAGIGSALYQNLVVKKQTPSFAAATAPPRILSFQGRLTDNLDNPITTPRSLRFMIYNSSSASGAAELWEERRTVVPDQDGIFSVYLGADDNGSNASVCGAGTYGTFPPASPYNSACLIPPTVFSDNSNIWLGVTVETTTELTPRQKIATVAYATNSEFLQGMPPTTQAGITNFANTVLALGSETTPTLSIGGSAGTKFTATAGQFTLSGQPLLLTTNSGTNGYIILSPDGLGKIDFQKPLVNTSTTGNLTPGGVEVNDKFGVLATESAVAAFTVNNDAGGNIFTASSSGTPKFTIQSDGTLVSGIYTGQNAVIYGTQTTGVLAQVTTASSGFCLQSGVSTPTWGSCGGQNYWRLNLGTISPINDTLDLLIGADTTASAKFRFLNVYTGTPVASVSANSGNRATYVSGDGNIGTTERQTLTIGNSSSYNSTGNILINPNGIGRIGIGRTNPLATLDIFGTSGNQAAASISANTSSATVIVDNKGNGDLFTASSSGVPQFVIRKNGDVVIGPDGEGKITVGIIDPWLVQNQKTSGTQSLTYQTMGASGADHIFLNQSTELGRLTMTGQLQLPVTGSSGGLVIGGDTQLFRGDTNRLDLASGDSFNIVNGSLLTGGTVRIDSSGNGTFNTLTVSSCTGCLSASNSPFQILNGAIVPLITTTDFLIGSQATASAKFAVLNINGNNTPTASVSAVQNGTAALISGDGSLQTVRKGTLTIGGGNTGNINIQGNGILTVADASVSLTGTNPTFSATGTNTLTLQNGSTGNLQFFSSSNTLSSAGALTIAGNATVNGTTIQLGNGSPGTIQTTSNQNLTLSAGSGTLNLNTVSNGAVTTGTGLTTVGGNLTVAGATTTFSNASPLITTSANASLTLTPNGSGNLVFTGDFDSQVLIGASGATTEFPLFVNNGIGSNASLAVNNPNSGDLFTASSSGTTRFTIANNGNISATGTLSGLTGLTLASGPITLGGSTGTGLCLLGGANASWGSCAAAAGDDWEVSSGAIYPNLASTLDFLIGGTSTASAEFAVLNINGSNTPVASVSATAGGNAGNGIALSGDGRIQSLRNNTLTLGGNTTGEITFAPNAETQDFVKFTSDGTNLSLLTTDSSNLTISPAGNLVLDSTGGTIDINDGTLDFATQATDFELIDNNANALTISQGATNFITVSTVNSSETLTLGNTTANTALSLLSGGTGDITLDSADTIVFTDFTGGGSGCSLTTTSGGVLTCGSAPSISDSKWTQNNTLGTLTPNISTLDVLYGGTATNSAKFAILNLAGSLTPVASVSATTGSNATKGIYISGDGSLQSVRNNTLTVGGNTTGNISLMPGGTNGTGFVGIGTNSPAYSLHVRRTAAGSETQPLFLNNGDSTNGSAVSLTLGAVSGNTVTGKIMNTRVAGSNYSLSFHNFGANGLFETARFDLNGSLGVGTTSPLAGLDVRGTLGTTPIASFSGITSFASLMVDNRGLGDIFTASTGGVPKFTIRNNGSLVSSHYRTAGGIFYGDGLGNFTQTTAGALNECLKSAAGGAPTWGACGSGGDSFWNLTAGVLHPGNSTVDLAIGGTSSSSAKFLFANVNAGTPTLKIFNEAKTQSLNLFHDGTDGNIISTIGTLNLGQGGGTLYLETDIINDTTNFNGAVKIADKFLVQKSESAGTALAVFDNLGTGDILTASVSGVTKFTIKNDGSASTSGNLTIDGTGALSTVRNQTLNIGNNQTGNIIIDSGNNVTKFADNAIQLSGSAPVISATTTNAAVQLNANGAGTLTLNSGATGNIQFFSSSNTLSSAGNLTLAGDVILSTGNFVGFSGANANLTFTDSGASDTVTFSNVASLLTDITTLNVFNATATTVNFAGAATTLAMGASGGTINVGSGGDSTIATTSNGSLTLTPLGSGELTLTSDFNTGVNIGLSTNTPAPLSISGGMGSNAALIVNQLNSGDLFTASASGVTRFAITNGGGISLGGSVGSGTQCITGGTTASWGTCGSGGGSNWRYNLGTLSPVNDTVDLLLGSNATSSAKFAVLNMNGTGPATATVSGNLIVMPRNGAGGFFGLGTANPTEKLAMAGGNFIHTATGNPTQSGAYTSTMADSDDVYISGKYAYVADESDGIYIIDISIPTNPTLVSLTSGSAYGVSVVGRYAYIARGNSGMSIIDITDPFLPKTISTYDTTGFAKDVKVSGRFAYVADQGSGVFILDISDPTNIQLASIYDSSGTAEELYIQGKYLYLGDSSGGLKVINISNPYNPVLSGSLAGAVSPDDVYVAGSHAYVTSGASGLHIINISNPTSPTLTGTYDTAGSATGVYVSGNYAYVADGNSGVTIVNVSVPSSPTLVGSIDTSGYSDDIFIAGKYAYVADNTGGLVILNINGVETPSLFAGNILTNDLFVSENADIGGALFVRNSLGIGQGGIFSQGALAVSSGTSSGSLIMGAPVGKALLTLNQTGNQDIFTASSSGTTRFTISNSGYVGINRAPISGVALAIGGADNTKIIALGVNADNSITFTSALAGAGVGSIGVGPPYAGSGNHLWFVGDSVITALDIWQTSSMAYDKAQTSLRVGVGTSASPINGNLTAQLQVLGATSHQPAASISANTSAPTLLVTNDNASGDLIVASRAGLMEFRVTGEGEIYAWKLTGTGGDFAEYMKKANPNEQFTDGSLVCLIPDGVTLCNSGSSNQKVVGVVSDNAVVVGGGVHKNNPNYILVGLVGQLGVKVTGQVNKGDPLTASTIPGYAIKATREGKIVGYAMENNDDGKVRVASVIQPTYYNPYTAFAEDNIFNGLTLSFNNGVYKITDSIGNTIDRTTAFSKAIIADLKVGFARIRNLTVDSFSAIASSLGNATASTLAVTTDSITIGGQNIRDFIIDTVRNAGFGNGISSPIAEVKTNILSPLADNASVQVNLNRDSVEVKNTETSKTVARIDNQGNATFSGDLIARNIESENTTTSTVNTNTIQTNEATVAGTLRAGNIVASNIEGLDQKLATLAAQIVNTQNSGGQTATGSSSFNNSNYLAVDTVQANFGIFEHGITSMGPITTDVMTATDQLAVGVNFSIANNAINTIGADLEFQSFRQGNIVFQGGLIKMDTDGNMTIAGNLNVMGEIDAVFGVFSGTLTTRALVTNLISPLAGEDLAIKLTSDTSSSSGQLRVQNSQGENVLSVNNKGDILASGAATLSKLNFNLVGEAQASTLREAVATGSAGFATLRAGQPEITIKNPNVTKDSLIYITPFGNTNNKVLYLLRQVPQSDVEDGSFTIGISGTTTTQNIQFNWLIVN